MLTSKLPALAALTLGVSLLPSNAAERKYRVEQLSPKAQKAIKQHGFLITDRVLKQPFDAYLHNANPFITSDSVLMVYTRLLQEVVADTELVIMADHLAHWEKKIDHNLKLLETAPDKMNTEAKKHARIIAGISEALLTGKVNTVFPKDEQKLIQAELGRVIAGTATTAPDWWTADTPMFYASCRPTGKANSCGVRQRWFRYQRWLSNLPLDHTNKLHVATCTELKSWGSDPWCNLIRNYSGVLARSGTDPEPSIEDLIKKYGSLAKAPMSPEGQLIDSLLNQPNAFLSVPESLRSIAPAIAGIVRLTPSKNKEAQEWVDFLKKTHHRAIYDRGSRAVAQSFWSAVSQLHNTDKRAPKLFFANTWKAKQDNCALAAWAEYTYATAGLYEDNFEVAGYFEPEGGVIEPIPDFFIAMQNAAQTLASYQDNVNALRKENHQTLLRIQQLGILEQIDKQLNNIKEGKLQKFDAKNIDFLGVSYPREVIGLTSRLIYPSPHTPISSISNIKTVKFFRDLLKDSADPSKERPWMKNIEAPNLVNLEPFKKLCGKLACLVHKQLSHKPWTKKEKDFFKNYDKHLGKLLGYPGDNIYKPRDNFPIVARSCQVLFPSSKPARLHIGSARPREIWILYPNKKGDVALYRGACYAFKQKISEKPDLNATWKSECDKLPWLPALHPVLEEKQRR